jgi:lysophospholipid acyltransferase (LPLAT)-like uncharacterized protein
VPKPALYTVAHFQPGPKVRVLREHISFADAEALVARLVELFGCRMVVSGSVAAGEVCVYPDAAAAGVGRFSHRFTVTEEGKL